LLILGLEKKVLIFVLKKYWSHHCNQVQCSSTYNVNRVAVTAD